MTLNAHRAPLPRQRGSGSEPQMQGASLGEGCEERRQPGWPEWQALGITLFRFQRRAGNVSCEDISPFSPRGFREEAVMVPGDLSWKMPNFSPGTQAAGQTQFPSCCLGSPEQAPQKRFPAAPRPGGWGGSLHCLCKVRRGGRVSVKYACCSMGSRNGCPANQSPHEPGSQAEVPPWGWPGRAIAGFTAFHGLNVLRV